MLKNEKKDVPLTASKGSTFKAREEVAWSFGYHIRAYP